MNYCAMQLSIIKCVIRSEFVSDILKIMILSYLFFNLCWDFPYYKLCDDIESGVDYWISYDFLDGDNDVSKN